MLDIKFIRENPEKVKEGITKKGVKADINALLELDKKKRELIKKIDDLKAQKNVLSGDPAGRGKTDEAIKIKSEIQDLGSELKVVEEKFSELMYQLPNLPLEDVPLGKNEKNNVVIKEVGEKPKFGFPPKDYLTLGESLHVIEIKRAAKISGSRFGYLKHEGAVLELALVQFAFETLFKEGFAPVIPPVLIEKEMMKGMGFIDDVKVADEVYHLEKDDLYLVGTSEQSVIPVHSGDTLSIKELPHRHVAFSTCFRREAGSYGKDTKGILRVHQFDKVEMLSITSAEESEKEHEFLLSMAEKLMQSLVIPYRVVKLCAGDLSRPSAKTYDIEAWLPGANEYRETHSISNTTDFQARRLNIKYQLKTKDSKPKTEFAHILNGTAFAIGRTLIAILENYQQKDGSIDIPVVLRKYVAFDKIKKR